MRRVLLLPLLCCTLSSSAQFKIYTTVEDLVNKTSIDYPDHDIRSIKGLSDTQLIIEHPVTKDQVSIDCTRIWGFMFKGEFFRVMKQGRYYAGNRNNFPVIFGGTDGKVCYWLNGAFLEELKRDKSFAALDRKMPGFVSFGVEGDAMAVALAGNGPTWMQEGGDNFFRHHEEAKWLQDCVRQERKRGYVHSVVKKCISDRAQTIRDTQ